MHRLLPCLAAIVVAASAAFGAGGVSAKPLPSTFPSGEGRPGEEVRLASSTPFTLADVGAGAPPRETRATLYLPDGAAPRAPVPAAVLLHGSGRGAGPREHGYGRRLAAAGVAALVVDTYGSRGDVAEGYVERVLNITEASFMADAYAGLAFLSKRPEIDPVRVAAIGFSYGGIAAITGASAQVATALAPDGRRFAAHVGYYAPCIGELAESRTTGAPVLMLMGDRDAVMDVERCEAQAASLRAGGSPVTMHVYKGAYHQWDGEGDRNLSRGIKACRFRLERDGRVTDIRTGLGMNGRSGRMLALSLCSDGEGYLIRRDPAIRARSDADLARFLNEVFGATAG